MGVDSEPALGAHLVTGRSGYEHHGIYVGDGKVVHYAGFAQSMHRGAIEETTLQENIKEGGKGRGTRYPSWTAMAKAVDEQLYIKKPAFKGMAAGSLLGFLVKYGEQANTFQHGGLFSIVLQDKSLPPKLLENFAYRCVRTMVTYLQYIAMLEGIPIDELRRIHSVKTSAVTSATVP